MKKLLTIIIASVLCICSATAQNSQREEIIDSIAARATNSPLFRTAIKEAISNFESFSPQEKILTEFIFFDSYRQVFDKTTEHISNDLLRTYNNPVMRFCWSKDFYQGFAQNLVEAFRFELGENTSFSYTVNDPRAVELRGLIENSIASLFSKEVPKISKTISIQSGYSSAQSVISTAIERITKHTSDIIIKSLAEYFSIEDLIKTFSNQIFRHELSNLTTHTDKEKIELANLYIQEQLNNIQNSPKLAEELCKYVELSRGEYAMTVFSRYRPIIEITEKKYTYKGESRYGVPHGKGCMTDKKGIQYKGDFRNGRRHGLIEVTYPGAEPILQVWVNDKYNKKLPVCKPTDGCDLVAWSNNIMGYASTITVNGVRKEGFFIDGELCGKGTYTQQHCTIEGEWEYDEMIDGTVTYSSPEFKTNEFHGRQNGEYLIGEWHKRTADDSYEEWISGVFTDTPLDSKATIKFKMPYLNSIREGIFAYGQMHGMGKLIEVSTNSENSIRDSVIYKGHLLFDKPNGEGKAEIYISNVPKDYKYWWYARLGVKIENIQGNNDVLIVFDGKFKDGVLIEGKVEASNGTTMHGTFKDEKLYDGVLNTRINNSDAKAEIKCSSGVFSSEAIIYYPDGKTEKAKYQDGNFIIVNEKKGKSNRS